MPAKYGHKEKMDNSQQTKVTRFFSPVVAIKTVPSMNSMNEYTEVHVSFQSTTSCYLSIVSTINEYKHTVNKRTRGYNEKKNLQY